MYVDRATPKLWNAQLDLQICVAHEEANANLLSNNVLTDSLSCISDKIRSKGLGRN